MPPIEMRALRPVAEIESRIAQRRDSCDKIAAPALQAKPTITAHDALDPGASPVDAQRVAEIRKAVERGSFPVIPVRIADAMIAAGLLLRSPK